MALHAQNQNQLAVAPRRTTSWMILRYALTLGVLALLVLASHFTLDAVLTSQRSEGALINLSGQQRMLSQRIQMLTERLAAEHFIDDRKKLADAITTMEKAHEELTKNTDEHTLSPALHELYFGAVGHIDQDVRNFLTTAREILKIPPDQLRADNPYIRALRAHATAGLLERLDAVVRQIQAEHDDAMNNLTHLAHWETVLILLALALSAVVVFHPLVRRVERDMISLHEVQRRLRGILDSALDAIVTIDSEGRVMEFNRSAEAMFGYRQDVVRGQDIADLIIPQHARNVHKEGLRRHVATNNNPFFGRRVEVTAQHADGHELPVELTITAFPSDQGPLLTAFLRDLTRRKKAEATVSKLSRAVEQSPAAVMITDTHGQIEYINPKFVEMTGYSPDEIMGKTPNILSTGHNSPEVYREMWQTISSGQEWRGEIYNRKKDGSCFWAHMVIAAIRAPEGAITHYVAVQEDLTLRKQYEEKLLRQSSYDSLTELPNRLLALDRLSQEVARANRQKHTIAVMVIDLDRFKLVNSMLGHEVGNRVLIDAARALRTCVREADTIARLDGDEFLAILPDLESAAAAETIAQRVIAGLTLPLSDANRYELVITASVGLAFFPTDGDSPQALIQSGETAMQKAKEAGRNTYRFFTPEMNRQLAEHLEVESLLRRAQERQELFLNFQPMVDPLTRNIIGAEALLRWRSAELGLVMPDRFIPVAEMSGLIVPIGTWVLRSACFEARRWQEETGQSLRVAVNVSPCQLQRSNNFVDVVAQALSDSGLAPEQLDLEITESLLVDDSSDTVELLRSLREIGVHISIDDFGTGYSSLRYLRNLPVSVLKIDRSFVRDISSINERSALVDAMIAMAHGLGFSVVAEGVEEENQLAYLVDRHCDVIQGYLFGRPQPAADFLARLKEG